MPKELTWDDADDLGILLSEQHPETDPLAVRFTDLHRLVTELPDFKDDPKKSNEGKLEAIQMAWHSEFLDRTRLSASAAKPLHVAGLAFAPIFRPGIIRGIEFPVVLLQYIKRLLVLSVIRNQSLAVVIILCAGQQAAR